MGIQNRVLRLTRPCVPYLCTQTWALCTPTWALCTLHGPCVPNMGPFQNPFGTPGGILEALKPRKNRCFYCVLYNCALVAQQRIRTRPDGPKRPPGAAYMTPKDARELPRGPQEAPTSPQEAPRSRPDGPKSRPGAAQVAPRAAREPPRVGPMYPNMGLVHSTWALCTQHGPFPSPFGTPG